MRKSDLQKELQAIGITPNKALSQNFLLDEEIAKKIVFEIKKIKSDIIIEIGPGLGVLSEYLMKLGSDYVGIEKDPILAARLSKKLSHGKIITGDILKIAYEVTNAFKDPYVVVANLPYNISGRVLRLFLSDLTHKPEAMLFMLQKEVAEKCVARPGEMNKVSVLTQLYSESHILFTVEPDSFYPKPTVDSAVILFKIKKEPRKCFPQNEKLFWQIVRIGFSAKRKKLANNMAAGLQRDIGRVRKTIKSLGFNEDCRAQELSIAQWVNLVDKIAKNY